MTDVLFINPTQQLLLTKEVNGTMLLATKLLQANIPTKILRFCQIEGYNEDYETFIRNMTEKILQIDPKCVSFYTLWPNYHIMLRIAREIKNVRPDIVTVFGGPQASATADEAMHELEYIDYVCTGEGENTVVPFFRAVLGLGGDLSEVKGLYYRVNGQVVHNDLNVPLVDLNTLPHWDERLYENDYSVAETLKKTSDPTMPIDVGRGCPYNCTFCSTSYFFCRTYRLKSPDAILNDIHYYKEKYGIQKFVFSHDAFTVNNTLVEAVCDRLIENNVNITWECATRINCITEELVLKMIKAGMTAIEMGIETGSERMQKISKKNLDLSKVKPMVDFCLKQGLKVSLFFMHAFPEETEQDLNETLELVFSVLDMGVHYANMSYCAFNPKTELTAKYFDRLVYDPRIKILSRDVWGYQEEVEVIKSNKAIFSSFYHLDTPMRYEFQYLGALVFLYRRMPNTMRYLRQYYNGDYLRLYRDFYNRNLSIFDLEMDDIVEAVKKQPMQIVENILQGLDIPNRDALWAVCEYECDWRAILDSREDTFIRKTYGFAYGDLKNRKALEIFASSQTTMLMQKIGGKMGIRILGQR